MSDIFSLKDLLRSVSRARVANLWPARNAGLIQSQCSRSVGGGHKQMGLLVHDEIVDHVGESLDNAPVEVEVVAGRAGAPVVLATGHLNLVVACSHRPSEVPYMGYPRFYITRVLTPYHFSPTLSWHPLSSWSPTPSVTVIRLQMSTL